MPRRLHRTPALDPATMLQAGILILAFVTAIGIGLLVVKEVRKAMAKGEDADDKDPLGVFRKSFERGEMDEAEYQRIRESLNKKPPGESAGAIPPKPREGGSEIPPPEA